LVALAIGETVHAAPPGSRWGADHFPNVPLVTQDGRQVRLYDDLLKGKAVVVNVIYTRCRDLCPLETAKLAQVHRLLGDRVGRDIFFYSISIDPKHDTPSVLKDYMGKFQVGPGWLFLTGEKRHLDLAAKKLGLWSRTDADDPDGHLPSLMLGNEAMGQWMRTSAVDNPSLLAMTISNFLTPETSRAPGRSYAHATALRLERGQHLFATKCAACHAIGRGDGIGPDLMGVTKSRDRGWLARFIAEPDRLRREGDPTAAALLAKYRDVQMPNLRLTPTDVAELIAYLETQSSPTTTAERHAH
jgi:protein SCO1/2